MTDEEDISEALDESVVEGEGDFGGDDVGEDLPAYPPDRPYGVDTIGVTPIDQALGDTFAERTCREVPEHVTPEDRSDVGQLVEPHASARDDEEELVAEEEPGEGGSPEEAAMFLEPEGPQPDE